MRFCSNVAWYWPHQFVWVVMSRTTRQSFSTWISVSAAGAQAPIVPAFSSRSWPFQ
jgi:hypothetical protein